MKSSAQSEFAFVPKTYGVLVLKGDRYVTVRRKVPPPTKPGQIWKGDRWITPRKRKKPTKTELRRVQQEEHLRSVFERLLRIERMTPEEDEAQQQERAQEHAIACTTL